MITNLFSEIKTLEEQGFWADYIWLDQLMIERRTCPKCKKNLTYKGLSNATHYKAFGICEPCKFARLFWTEVVKIAVGKKKFSREKASV